MVAIASSAITFALVFYTIGVFAERRAGTLKLSHIMFFYLGLACDTAGTAVIAPGNSASPAHAITGALAIVLMVIHALWASVVFVKKNHERLERFHRFSVGVWLAWLIPYFCGMFMGIPALKLDSNIASVAAIGATTLIGLLLCVQGNARRR